MINAATFLIILFFLPETLFDRAEEVTQEIFADDKEKIEEIEDVSSEPYRSPPMEIKDLYTSPVVLGTLIDQPHVKFKRRISPSDRSAC